MVIEDAVGMGSDQDKWLHWGRPSMLINRMMMMMMMMMMMTFIMMVDYDEFGSLGSSWMMVVMMMMRVMRSRMRMMTMIRMIRMTTMMIIFIMMIDNEEDSHWYSGKQQMIFRCASISSTYPCEMSLRPSVRPKKLVWPKKLFDQKNFQKCVASMQVFWVQTFSTQRLPSPNFFKLSVPGGLRIFRAFASLFFLKLTKE